MNTSMRVCVCVRESESSVTVARANHSPYYAINTNTSSNTTTWQPQPQSSYLTGTLTPFQSLPAIHTDMLAFTDYPSTGGTSTGRVRCSNNNIILMRQCAAIKVEKFRLYIHGTLWHLLGVCMDFHDLLFRKPLLQPHEVLLNDFRMPKSLRN